jgi:dienelactone hydrolase
MKLPRSLTLFICCLAHALGAAEPAQIALDQYFEKQVSAVEGQLEREIQTKEDWLAKKDEYRRQLREMLGIDPLPPRTDLKATKTGEFEQDGVVVVNLHYQSMPGLYVTANLYRPKVAEKPLPMILYVCGHAVKEKNGVRYGNKAGYEHHGMWYAKHGFVCLVIDTVQLGEIRGEHHGTYSKDRLWWFSRGYTPAGVEAWAGIRALDYLETRPEVDKTRFGVTGRSGGGAYSWWIAALDERIACAAPTAGITTLRNHVVDDCIEGHCDCMFMVNTYRWDYDKLAALVAPRPLCIVNTDKDTIFPIDGVFKIYQSTRRIYKLLDAEKNIGLQVAEGPHADTQPLNTGEFHWMTRFLQGAELMSTLDAPAVKSIDMEKLRVFPVSSGLVSADTKQPLTPGQQGWPGDQRNTRIDEIFVSKSSSTAPADAAEWAHLRDSHFKSLRDKVFAGWAPDSMSAKITQTSQIESDGIVLERFEIMSAEGIPLSLFVSRGKGTALRDLELIALNVLDEEGWKQFTGTYASRFPALFPAGSGSKPNTEAFEQEKKMFATFKWGMAYVCPRDVGPTEWDQPIADPTDKKAIASAEKAHVQRLRRFYLLGQTLEGQQVWDVRFAIRALRTIEGLGETKLWLQASRAQAANALMASLFEDKITRLDLHELPHSLMPKSEGDASPLSAGLPAYLNMLKYLDIPQAVALAAERTRVVIYDNNKAAWTYPQQISEKLNWGKDKKAGLQLRDVPKPQ